MNRFYSLKEVLKNVALLCTLIALCKFTMGIGFAVMIVVLMFGLTTSNPVVVLDVIFVSVSTMLLGRFFVPFTVPLLVCQKVCLLLASVFLSVRIFGRRQDAVFTPVWALVPYMLFIALSSQSGWCPAISNMKLLLFCMVFFALYGAAVSATVDRVDIRRIRNIVLGVSIVIIFGSILSIPFPAISQMNGEELMTATSAVSLFRGVTCHSQSLGPFAGMLCTLLYGDYVFSIQKKDKLYLLLMLCCPLLIYKTSSRTAMASFLVGITIISYFAMKSRMVKRSWRSRIMSSAIFGVILIGLAFLAVPAFREKVARFIAKNYSGDNTLVSENVLGSRQAKLDFAIQNWRQSPWIGNGFQVSEDMKYIQIRGVKDILSAPVEKSTWMYAVLEEGGIFGMVLFCLFIVISIGLMIARKAYVGASMLTEFIFVNMGEFGIFSMSAEGGVFWCMVFIALVFDSKRLKALRRASLPPAYAMG